MRRHVIRSLGVMPITVFLGGEPLEKISQVQHDVGISVLLNHQRRGGVLDEQRQQAGFCFGRSYPLRHFAREGVQTLAARADSKNVVHYSTVTLLARLRGWS